MCNTRMTILELDAYSINEFRYLCNIQYELSLGIFAIPRGGYLCNIQGECLCNTHV